MERLNLLFDRLVLGSGTDPAFSAWEGENARCGDLHSCVSAQVVDPLEEEMTGRDRL